MIIEEVNGLRILRASEGKLLCRKGNEEYLSEKFYLGVNDSEDNFLECEPEETQAAASDERKEVTGYETHQI